MTRSNRVINRVLLALVGLALIAGGAWVFLLVHPGYLESSSLRLAAPDLRDATLLWTIAGVCLAVVVLSLLWIFSRGRGRTAQLLSADDGSITLDAKVVGDLVHDALGDNQDVVSVRSTAYRVRRDTVVELVVTARRGAELRRLVDAVNLAIADLDTVLETRIPVLLHIASGVRATLAHEQRVR